MRSKTFWLTALAVTAIAALSWVAAAHAADNSLIGRLSPACRDTGDCNFCDVLDGFSILTRWILGVCGVVALLFFVRFGLMFIISGGNSATVDKAKKGLMGTVIGLVIIFSAWEIVNLTIYAIITPTTTTSQGLNNPNTLKSVILFGGGYSWHEYCANRPGTTGRIPDITN